MKTLWNVISFLAVVHLLALIMFIGWLWQTGRLDRARIGDLRQYLSSTTAEARTAAAQSIKDAEAARLKEAQEKQKADPNADSETQIQRLTLISQKEDQTRRGLDQERKLLQQQLDQGTSKVSQIQADFEKQRRAWEESVKAERLQRVDAQFQQAVKLYEQAQPKQAKRMLVDLIAAKQTDQAVTYLDAMSVRAASKILKEFKTDEEIRVATELLEKLRTLGQPAGAATPSQGAGPTNAANSSVGSIPSGKPVPTAS